MAKEKVKRLGRPPKPVGETKAAVLTLRLTAEERKKAELGAQQKGVSLSAWSRLKIFGGSAKSR